MSALCGPWRLILDREHEGAWNMAADMALMEGDGLVPVLRLYGWQRPTLSLGYAQDADAVVDFALADAAGVEVVRRPTGGGAVLHDGANEVTYSVVAPEAALPGAVVEAYRLLAEALVAALGELGIRADLAARVAPADERSAVCFETPSRYELLVAGRKTVGSAQCRRYGRVLQHGAVPLRLDPGRAVSVLRTADRAALAERLGAHAAGLEQAAARPLEPAQVRSALVRGFERVLGAAFEPSGFTPRETTRRDELVRLGIPGPIRPGAGRALRQGLGRTASELRP